jgi:hypothetical protein
VPIGERVVERYVKHPAAATGWLADGDPGRTTVKASARRFDTERSARRAISKARRFREFPKATVEYVK